MQSKAEGTVLENPEDFTAEATYDSKNSNYKVNYKNGAKTSLDLVGEHKKNDDSSPCDNHIKLEIHTPSSKFSVLKFETTQSGFAPKESSNAHFLAKGTTSLFIDDDGVRFKNPISIQSQKLIIILLFSPYQKQLLILNWAMTLKLEHTMVT